MKKSPFFTLFVAQNGAAHARTAAGFRMGWIKIMLFFVVVANAITPGGLRMMWIKIFLFFAVAANAIIAGGFRMMCIKEVLLALGGRLRPPAALLSMHMP